jgi:uncharacterized repeat protein (TIGR01451 family)
MHVDMSDMCSRPSSTKGVKVNVLRSKIRAAGVAAALALPLGIVGLTAPAQAATVPGGAYAEGYGLFADVTLLSGALALTDDDLGLRARAASSCPPGGSKKASALDVGSDDIVHAEVINGKGTTTCSPLKATGVGQVTNVNALGAAAPIAIHADAVTATSETSCTAKPTGSTKIVGLSIGGNAIDLPEIIGPNTTFTDPILAPFGLRIILNEQHPAADGRGLVVNGIHIIAGGDAAIPIGGAVIRGDIVIAHAVSTVACPGGSPGQDNAGLPPSDIKFEKAARPVNAPPGTTVTYTAKVTNNSAEPCEVVSFIDHVAPAFEIVSTAGGFGTKFDTPPPVRTDGGPDLVLHPTGVTIGAKKSLIQTIIVKTKAGAPAGTYYDTLEVFCARNGDFLSGALAPVTVPGQGTVTPPEEPLPTPDQPETLPRTGGAPLIAVVALAMLGTAVGLRRFRARHDQPLS